jgi:hypothetical protein
MVRHGRVMMMLMMMVVLLAQRRTWMDVEVTGGGWRRREARLRRAGKVYRIA